MTESSSEITGIVAAQPLEKEKTELSYTVTNEQIQAVHAGFCVPARHHRQMLAVGGSGDIAFSLLPYTGHIDIVDLNPAQLDFIKHRIDLLKDGRFHDFLNSSLRGNNDGDEKLFAALKAKRDSYFLQDGMLDTMRSSTDKLNLLPKANLFDLPQSDILYSGIYLSNTLGLLGRGGKIRKDLISVRKKLDDNGLLYVANGDTFDNDPSQIADTGLSINGDLTSKSRAYSSSTAGNPTVFAKKLASSH